MNEFQAIYDDPIVFRKVHDPYGWLSNMSPYPVSEVGRKFRTAEALFQSLRFDDPEIVKQIQGCPSPMGAKMIAKKNLDKMIVKPRTEGDLNLMRAVIRAKVLQHRDLLTALLNTGDRKIIEDVTARPTESGLYWGQARSSFGWYGENHLGKLWMKLRQSLREEGHK